MIPNVTLLRLNDFGKDRYYLWEYKDSIFVYKKPTYNRREFFVYLYGEHPEDFAVLYDEDVEIFNPEIFSYEEMM